MTIAGNIYGVVLNDIAEVERLSSQFRDKPYLAPPVAPVVYMKPLSSLVRQPVMVPAETGLVASATMAVLIARDTARASEGAVASCFGAMALALDLSLPSTSYYRPPVAQKSGDGRLALGTFAAPQLPGTIILLADGTPIHEWSLDRLMRPLEQLIVELSAFMTMKAGDLLLIGLPGDAPVIHGGQSLRVKAAGMPSLNVATQEENA